jgi:peptidoglycan hydrolase CwlO-like protein
MITFEQYTIKQTEASHLISILKSVLSIERVVETLANELENKSSILARKTTEVTNLQEENERLKSVIKHLEACLNCGEEMFRNQWRRILECIENTSSHKSG